MVRSLALRLVALACLGVAFRASPVEVLYPSATLRGFPDLSDEHGHKIADGKLAQWIEGTRTLQPISIAIMRSIPPEITISDISFERSSDIPAQINLNVRINNGSMEEVSHIQTSLQNMNYRPYNSQQLKNGETLEYKTMLVFQQL